MFILWIFEIVFLIWQYLLRAHNAVSSYHLPAIGRNNLTIDTLQSGYEDLSFLNSVENFVYRIVSRLTPMVSIVWKRPHKYKESSSSNSMQTFRIWVIIYNMLWWSSWKHKSKKVFSITNMTFNSSSRLSDKSSEMVWS